jgi:hypothetical protein
VRRTRARQTRHECDGDALRARDKAGGDGGGDGGGGAGKPDVELLALLDTIAKLPRRDREAIAQRFYRGADLAAVGRALDVTPEAARKRVSRALVTLRELMLRDGIDVVPSDLLARLDDGHGNGRGPERRAAAAAVAAAGRVQRANGGRRTNSEAKGATTMTPQTQTDPPEAETAPARPAEFPSSARSSS